MAKHTGANNRHADPWVWGPLTTVLTITGGAFAWLVYNYEAARPVLASPAMLIIILFATYGMGGLSAYWVVARPVIARLGRAEDVIKALRDQERDMLKGMGDMKALIARLEERVQHLQDEVARMPQTRARTRKPAAKT